MPYFGDPDLTINCLLEPDDKLTVGTAGNSCWIGMEVGAEGPNIIRLSLDDVQSLAFVLARHLAANGK